MHVVSVCFLLKMLAFVSCFRMDLNCQWSLRKLLTFHTFASVTGTLHAISFKLCFDY